MLKNESDLSKRLFVCVFLIFFYASAQKFTNYIPYLKYETDTANSLKNKEIGVVPIFFRTPETGIASGVLFSALFKMPGVTDPSTRTSNLVIPFIYTQFKQFTIGLQYNLITNREKWYIRGTNAVQDFNEYYYGIGNKAIENERELIAYKFLRITQRVAYRFYGRHFAGIQVNHYNTWQLKGDSLLALNEAIGNKGYCSTGFGLVYFYDNRDNIISSTKGSYLDISTLSYTEGLLSDYSFRNLTIDFRKFYSPFKNQTFAFNAIINMNDGDVPFMQVPHMGGQYMMRGYYYGRFRDNIYTAMQLEYRLKVWKFFGVALFGAVGNVVPNFKMYDFNTLKYTYGAGLRFSVSKKERVNIRFDVGYGEDFKTYLSIGEAF
jgi:hypothetical protein